MTACVTPGLDPGIFRNMTNDTAFSYKPGSSFLHRCPAWIKILLIPAVSIAVFKLPFYCTAGLCLVQIILASVLRFSIREQLRDLKAVLYYAVFLIFAKVIGSVGADVAAGRLSTITLSDIPQLTAAFFVSEAATWALLLRLLCVMQTASLIFKTSTSLQIREGLESMELAVRNVFRKIFHLRYAGTTKPHAPLAQAVSLFICFIPQVSKNWQQSERAWKARGGRKSLRMFVVLLPVFFSVGMKQAYNTAKAISARQCS